MDDATKKAKADKEIPLEELWTDVYSNNVEPTIRNKLPWNPLTHKRLGPAVNFN